MRKVRDLDAIVDVLREHEGVASFKLNPECRPHTTNLIVRVTGLSPSTLDLDDICKEFDLEVAWSSPHPTGDLSVAIQPTEWGEEDA